jgi:hypothetical protein
MMGESNEFEDNELQRLKDARRNVRSVVQPDVAFVDWGQIREHE